MVVKRILCPERLRRVPKQFSWVDHCLVRDKRICGLSHASLALYLFLVTVGDADGISFYSDAALTRLLTMDVLLLVRARLELCNAGLIAYSRPLYQVLSLEQAVAPVPAALCEYPSPRSAGEATHISNVLRQILGGGQ
jgi:hypothetical protein